MPLIEILMWLMLIPVLLCVVAVWHDVKRREIPDRVSWLLLISGLVSAALGWHAVSFAGSVFGVVVGFSVVLPFAMREGIGGGDLKLVASLGAWLGVPGMVVLLFWSAISGMVVAILTHLRGQKDFPFAPAILLGLLIAVIYPQSLERLIDMLQQA